MIRPEAQRVMAELMVSGPAEATARAPGTCGELVQGRLRDGTDFLVTLPIDMWSEVRLRLDPDGGVNVTPPWKVKTQKAVRLALDALGCRGIGAQVEVISELPEGKGMASSTADIVAACRAAAQAAGGALDAAAISAIARQIEPSDGVMYYGVVAYAHRRCELIAALGSLPLCDVLVIDLDGEVDTVAYNHRAKDYSGDELDAIERAYGWVRDGLARGNRAAIGRGATLSARINQRLLPKPPLEAAIRLATRHGAAGVCVAHSGTVIGLLFAPLPATVRVAVEHDLAETIRDVAAFWTRTLGGGDAR